MYSVPMYMNVTQFVTKALLMGNGRDRLIAVFDGGLSLCIHAIEGRAERSTISVACCSTLVEWGIERRLAVFHITVSKYMRRLLLV